MLKRQIYWMLLLSLLGFASCGDDDNVGFVEKTSLIQFDFPQGNDPWDKEIEQIAKDWDMYIIYKDIDSTHLNQMWTNPIYYDPIYVGKQVSNEEVQIYLNLIKEWLLGSLDINKQADKDQLPYYFYILNDFNDGNPRSRTYQKNHVRIKKDGFNYWSLSFTTEELEAGLTPEIIHNVACAYSYPGLKVRFQSGEYKVAPEFASISDYEGKIGLRYYSMEAWLEDNSWAVGIPDVETMYENYTNADERDPVNAYQRRGFAPQITESFKVAGNYGCPTWMPWIPIFSFPNPDGSIFEVTRNPDERNLPDVEGRVLQDFLNMIRLAMFYTEETVREKFPVDVEDPLVQSGNQKINEKYDLVVKYMKEAYNIDLPKYAAILEGE